MNSFNLLTNGYSPVFRQTSNPFAVNLSSSIHLENKLQCTEPVISCLLHVELENLELTIYSFLSRPHVLYMTLYVKRYQQTVRKTQQFNILAVALSTRKLKQSRWRPRGQGLVKMNLLFIFEFCNCLNWFSAPIGLKTCLCLTCNASVHFQIKIQKITADVRVLQSTQNLGPVHTLYFCRVDFHSIKKARYSFQH